MTSPELSTRRQVLFASIIVASALVLAVLGLELFLRWAAPQPLGPVMFAFSKDLGMIPVPGQKARRTFAEDPAYAAHNTAEGHRATRNASRADASRRILVLGDSFTYGVGVNDEESYSSQLEELLTSPSAVVAVHNAGNPGVGTDYALKYLQVSARKIRPSAVVIGFFVNDFADNEGERYYRLVQERLEPQNLLETFAFYYKKSALSQSAVYQWFCERSHALSLTRRWVALVASGGVGDFKNFLYNRSDLSFLERGMAHPNGVDMTTRYFAAIRDEVKSVSVPLLVAYLPSIVDVRTVREKGHITGDELAWAEIMKGLGIDAVSLTPVLAGSGKALSELYLNEGHWTALSHRLAAQALAARLRSSVK